MRIALALATLVGVCMLLGAAPSTAPVAAATTPPGGGQPPDPGSDQLIAIVESFLLARAMGDFAGAAGWCASLLELQDSDGSWFVDAPSTREWLRQLANRYVIDTLTHPTAESNTVVWTERLSQRGIPFPEALRSSISVQVHAVIRDGKIAYLSGPYPPIPFRSGSASGEPGLPGGPTSAPAIHPFTLFVGSALGLAVAVPLANVLSPALYTAVLHGWKWRSSPVQRNHPRGNSRRSPYSAPRVTRRSWPLPYLSRSAQSLIRLGALPEARTALEESFGLHCMVGHNQASSRCWIAWSSWHWRKGTMLGRCRSTPRPRR